MPIRRWERQTAVAAAKVQPATDLGGKMTPERARKYAQAFANFAEILTATAPTFATDGSVPYETRVAARTAVMLSGAELTRTLGKFAEEI